MAFHFALETVLRYRRTLEERECIRLQTLLARRVAAVQKIEALRAARTGLRTNVQRSLEQKRLSAAELQLCVARSNSIEQAAARVRLELKELETEIMRQIKQYRGERQRSEVLQSLRDAQQREYFLTQQRREQAMLDELYLLRRDRNRY